MQDATLFEQFQLPSLSVPNRLVMAPMTRTRATDSGVPTALMEEYYVQRASAGLIVTECTEVSEQGRGIVRAPGVYRPDQIEGWRKITDAVHRAGGRIYLQVWHCGRVSHPVIRNGDLPVAPSPLAAEGLMFTPQGRIPFPVPRELGLGEIYPIVESFGHAAANAKAAGFDGVELHGAFGYLPDQFLQSGTNQRTDGYGGRAANRARFMVEVVEAMTGAWDRERVGVKLSPSNRFYGMFDADARETFGYVISALDAMRVGYLHLMEPNANDMRSGTVQLERVAEAFRPLISVPVVTNGGYDRNKAEAALAAGLADLVSFGVPFVANPDLPARLQTRAPLNIPDPDTFYGEGPKGYTDYPALEPHATLLQRSPA